LGSESLFGDDTGFADEGIGERALAVVHMGNHGHVPNVVLVVHDLTDLFYCEVHHFLLLSI
jgi:hypothetical protein